jgi:L-threonine-O-3-phosphate decarboxylase
MKPFNAGIRSPNGREAAPKPRREALRLTAEVHGSMDLKEIRSLGQRPEEVLDFSANVNPYGPSPAVHDAVAETPFDRYPDRTTLKLRAALAESLGIEPEQILPGNGASELIWLVALAFIRPGSRVLILGPTFCEYARAARLMGGCVKTWQAREETEFVPEPTAIAEHLESWRPHVLFLCNPNNPTGAVLPTEVVADWAGRHARTLFVVDEAYLPFTAGLESALALAAANVFVLRSMTKDFGLAGLRLGYAVSDEDTIRLLGSVQPPWSVNVLAQAAGVAALRDSMHRQQSLDQLVQAKHELTAELTRLGLTPVPSATHFFLLRVGDGGAFRRALLRRGVLVRDCASFGLPAHVRIAARRPEENRRLLASIREVI